MENKTYNDEEEKQFSKFKEDVFYKDGQGKKIYIPSSFELAPQFIKRLVGEATNLSCKKDGRTAVITAECSINGEGTFRFDVSSDDDLYEALDKYYSKRKTIKGTRRK